ncbi:hypothetical protein HHL11_09530 [Ramlibacter sp. G-1-2-2]|uniref:Uncharacterized protein n=1 Tax=Ramlibacter agri TaxID=2728837 RepID=A0A848H3A1_9BURK|nr:hypothetical protein [Ramlibacter agri]NML43989.1 hypothetical protein [Ramlibacter agri]
MKTLSWAEAVASFEGRALGDAAAFLPLLAVAEFLAASRYARSLQPAMDGAVLVLRHTGDAAGAEVRVGFDARTHQFTLTHLQRPGDPRPWTRECGENEWQAALERLFHKRLQWFHEG